VSALEGVVEPTVPPQIGPGNVPGPLEPTVIDCVEMARHAWMLLNGSPPSRSPMQTLKEALASIVAYMAARAQSQRGITSEIAATLAVKTRIIRHCCRSQFCPRGEDAYV
jgi:hypothetical protein